MQKYKRKREKHNHIVRGKLNNDADIQKWTIYAKKNWQGENIQQFKLNKKRKISEKAPHDQIKGWKHDVQKNQKRKTKAKKTI